MGLLGDFLEVGVVVNLGFFIFNMIPIPPLDGSRALYAVAPEGVQRFMDFLEQNGLIIVFAVVMLFSSPDWPDYLRCTTSDLAVLWCIVWYPE